MYGTPAVVEERLVRNMTSVNLRSAFGGECMAQMRYEVWAAVAQRDGFPNVARLFRGVLRAEQIHAANHFAELHNEAGAHSVTSMGGFGIGTTAENLLCAIEGEAFEIDEMYPAYMQTARFEGEKGAERSFLYAISAERIHLSLYERARRSVEEGQDVRLGQLQVCNVCGCTLEGEAPDKCPVCSARKECFLSFV